MVTSTGTAVRLDPSDGTVDWSTDLASPPTSSPARTGGAERVILIVTRDGTLHALDPDDGGTRWIVRVSDDVEDMRIDPTVADRTTIIGDGHGNVVGIR